MTYKLIASLTALVTLFAPLVLPALAQNSSPVWVAQRPTEKDLTPAQRAALEQAITKAVAIQGKPKPMIRKLIVEGRYGLATWSSGEAGGMVAVSKQETWVIYRLGGGMPSAEAVHSTTDIPVAVARKLLQRMNSSNPSAVPR